ncbi:MAG: hypothetical protein LUF02_04525 [Erysipelotrichaceae bacterium]|nr:hypothetical protein [Erysipelotrichaceae bacterium]
MINIKKVADEADMIINGYAFKLINNQYIRVLNLNYTSSAAFLDKDAKILETSMDDIEMEIVCNYLKDNFEYLEGA